VKGGALEAEGSMHKKTNRIANSVAEARSGGAGGGREVAQGKTPVKGRWVNILKTLAHDTCDMASLLSPELPGK